jgi:hypothetical protein
MEKDIPKHPGEQNAQSLLQMTNKGETNPVFDGKHYLLHMNRSHIKK